MKKWWWLLGAVIVVLLGLGLYFDVINFPRPTVTFPPNQNLSGSTIVKMPNGKSISLIKIARDEAARAQGLSGLDSLNSNQGMWFEFDTPGYYPFWMKDMKFSIDIIWLDENHLITDIVRNVPIPYGGGALPTYQNTQPAKYVLEVNAGVSEGLVAGDILRISYQTF